MTEKFHPSAYIIMAGFAYEHGGTIGVQSLLTGKGNRALQKAAAAQAVYQAKRRIQGHQNWQRRYEELRQDIPSHRITEICAESWPRQGFEEAGPEMFHSWEQSPGHWQAANSPCEFYGYSMARGDNGVWYATGVVASTVQSGELAGMEAEQLYLQLPPIKPVKRAS